MSANLTHVNENGEVRMVDVTEKPSSLRVAVAGARIVMKPETLALIQSDGIGKGDVLATARIAGIMAAKKTGELIPMCHPLVIQHAEVEIAAAPDLPGLEITATVRLTGQTGVEMEALTAASIAALTIYDMAKAVDKAMIIKDVRLLHKSGGRSGTYDAEPL
jgi:cyclic pyranopterin monophosphate synthase